MAKNTVYAHCETHCLMPGTVIMFTAMVNYAHSNMQVFCFGEVKRRKSMS